MIRLLGDHALTLPPSLTGEWEHRLANIETGADTREAFMADIVRFAEETVATLDTTLKDVRIPKANLGPCPVCAQLTSWRTARASPAGHAKIPAAPGDLEVQGRQAVAGHDRQGTDQDRPHPTARHRVQESGSTRASARARR